MAASFSRFEFTLAVLAPIVIVALCIAVGANRGENAETVREADPAEVVDRLVIRLDTATAEIGLPVNGRKFNTVTCTAENFEVPPKDRYMVVGRYHFVPVASTENDDVRALYEYWGELGWDAEIRYTGGPGRQDDSGVGHSGFAVAEATDAGDRFLGETDWLETAVWVTSPCYLWGDMEPVWGEVTPEEWR